MEAPDRTTIETPLELVTSIADFRFSPKIDARLQALMDCNEDVLAVGLLRGGATSIVSTSLSLITGFCTIIWERRLNWSRREGPLSAVDPIVSYPGKYMPPLT